MPAPTTHDLSEARFTELLRAFDYKTLFNELGWDRPAKAPSFRTVVGDEEFVFRVVAEKREFLVFVCDRLPDAAMRRSLDELLTKRHYEHVAIFFDAAQQRQVWQFIVRDPDKTKRYFTSEYAHHQTPRLLWQRVTGLGFAFEEEEGLTLSDVRQRTRAAFATNAEAVTKKFYTQFSAQHKAFMAQIEGLPVVKKGEDDEPRRWYASLMLNRLMFLYFIQAQGYLDNNKNYLQDRLDRCEALVGKNKFHSFYKSFLRRLFHEGLNEPTPHDAKLQALIGQVPYLNGGLFEQHQLEKAHPKLSIPDVAFEKVFEFLSAWEWHLDTRITATGKHINPDVLGYIFERYINERAAMGAYYTKEDVTGYIARNCIVPALFDRIAAHATHPVAHGPEVWNLLVDDPDRYFYPAQRHGTWHELPPEIEAGRTDVAARTPHWNKTTPEEYGLPTEIWRETIARRERYYDAKRQLLAGEVTSINTLITLNLNVRQFVEDAIHNAGNPEWVWACFDSVRSLSVLDPTCGSGAFLFAALNILEPIYEACLDRMAAFLPELDNPKVLRTKKTVVEGMKRVRDEIGQHPNREYYITKTIILRNLYGVDLMHEAVEIAKVRLFLQLMSTLGEPDYAADNLGLEPLPDVDFNIRAGNTLVGFATAKELDSQAFLDFDGEIPQIKEQSDVVARAYQRFKTLQTDAPGSSDELHEAKEELRTKSDELKTRMNRLLHKQNLTIKYDEFCKRYQPFHWFAEFYGIISGSGGFDVIIGNPPYVEYAEVRNVYRISGYKTETCGNLYANVMELSLRILKEKAYSCFIVPLASFSTKRMQVLQNIYNSNSALLLVSNFEATSNPTVLFVGVKVQLSIVLQQKTTNTKPTTLTTKYYRSFVGERAHLLQNIYYQSALHINSEMARLNDTIEKSIITKIYSGKLSTSASFGTKSVFYYRNMGNFFYKLAFKSPPPIF